MRFVECNVCCQGYAECPTMVGCSAVPSFPDFADRQLSATLYCARDFEAFISGAPQSGEMPGEK
jgi:hypothetical protein